MTTRSCILSPLALATLALLSGGLVDVPTASAAFSSLGDMDGGWEDCGVGYNTAPGPYNLPLIRPYLRAQCN